MRAEVVTLSNSRRFTSSSQLQASSYFSEALHQLANPRDMPPTDRQRLAFKPLQVKLEMPQRCALQALDAVAVDQRIAVHPHETITEFVFQRLQRFVQQDFPGFMPERHVL